MEKKIKERRFFLTLIKNFKKTIFIIVCLWLLIGLIIYFVDPNFYGIKIVFYALVYTALIYTLTLVFADRKRAIVISTLIIVLFFLASIRMANFINIILSLGVYIVFEFYNSKKS